jgi:hypothetical protein
LEFPCDSGENLDDEILTRWKGAQKRALTSDRVVSDSQKQTKTNQNYAKIGITNRRPHGGSK